MFYKKPAKDHILLCKGHAQLARLPKRFSLCVWNLHKCKDTGWREEFALHCKQSDLFLTQEAMFLPSQEDCFANCGLEWTAAVSFFSFLRHAPIGVATGSRAPALRADYRANVYEPFLKTPKMTLCTVYPTDREPLLVVNLHAINFTGHKPFSLNMASAAQLLEGFDGPALVAGDFNVWNKHRLQLMRQTAAQLQLTEMVFEPDNRSRFFGQKLDFVFTRGLKLLQAQATPSHASDHNPLSAVLELQ